MVPSKRHKILTKQSTRKAGEEIIRQGDEGLDCFIVDSGECYASIPVPRAKKNVKNEATKQKKTCLKLAWFCFWHVVFEYIGFFNKLKIINLNIGIATVFQTIWLWTNRWLSWDQRRVERGAQIRARGLLRRTRLIEAGRVFHRSVGFTTGCL